MESLGQMLKSGLPGAPSCDLSPQEAQRELCKRRTQEFNAAVGDLNSTSLGGVDCPDCHNKGVIMTNRQAENGLWETRVRECKCMTTRRSIRRLVCSGLKDVTSTYTFRRYEAEKPWQKRLKEAAMGYVQDIRAGGTGWLYVGGQSGCGKTHLCSAVAAQLLKDGMGLRYMVWRDELRKLKAVANSPEYGEMLNEWKTVRVLYIDDFFKAARDQYGRMQPSEADVRIAFELLNYRSNDKSLLTIISSELSLDEIADIDEAIAGRIAQHAAGHCVTVAPDRDKNYRLKGVVSL